MASTWPDMQGPDGHIKPVPEAERLTSVRRPRHASTVDSDLAIAVRLQEEELSYASAQRPPTPSPRPPESRQRSAQPAAASRFARCCKLPFFSLEKPPFAGEWEVHFWPSLFL